MNKYLKVFKPFDIRAIYDQDIDDTFAQQMGFAFGKRCSQQHKTNILIANDTRPANNNLIKAFVLGLSHATTATITYADIPAQDKESRDLEYGSCSTSLAYYIVQQGFDYAVIFTASHNPKEYVGLKIVDSTADFVPSDTLRDMYQTSTYQDNETFTINEYRHTSIEKYLQENEERYMQAIKKIEGKYTVVIDFSNGSGCTREYDIIQKLQLQNERNIIYINTAADGTFPGHESDTSNPACYKQLIHEVQKHKADIGIMFDGDLDRIGVVDNQGQIVPGDTIGCLLAKKYLQENQGQAVYIDVLCSGDLYDTIVRYGGVPVITKTGRALMTPFLKKDRAILGIECSGHIMYRSAGYIEQPYMVAIDVIQMMEQEKTTLNQLIKTIQKRYRKSLVSIKVENPDKCIEVIEKMYSTYPIQHIDGLNIYSKDLRLTIRKSNTEPKIRIGLETQDEASREKHMTNILNSLQSQGLYHS